MKLLSMLSGNWFDDLATAIPAIAAIPEADEGKQAPTIAAIATIAVANPSGEVTENRQKTVDDAPSLAIAGSVDGMVGTFAARLELFSGHRLSLEDAQALAQRLVIRDLDHDERRLCLECQHLFGGAGGWRCSQWRKTGSTSPDLPSDLVTIVLHRCGGFTDRLEATA